MKYCQIVFSEIGLPLRLCEVMILPRSPPPQNWNWVSTSQLSRDTLMSTHLHHDIDLLLLLVENLVIQHDDVGVVQGIQNAPMAL